MGILKEALEPPLKIRRTELNIKTAIKIATIPNKITYKNTFSNRNSNILDQHPNLPRPFYHRTSSLQKEFGVSLLKAITRRISKIPPWKLTPINTNFDLSIYKKEETPLILFKSIYNQILDKHNDYVHIYTDGSKSDDGTGCAIIMQNNTSLIKLPDEASIFSAELTAIHQAIKIVSKHSDNKFITFSDSKSAINAISGDAPDNQLILETRELIHKETTKGKNMLCWIPSHIGIKGNEEADAAAKRAIYEHPNKEYNKLIHHHSDIIKHVKGKIKYKWNGEWNQLASKHITDINDEFYVEPLDEMLSRRNQILDPD